MSCFFVHFCFWLHWPSLYRYKIWHFFKIFIVLQNKVISVWINIRDSKLEKKSKLFNLTQNPQNYLLTIFFLFMSTVLWLGYLRILSNTQSINHTSQPDHTSAWSISLCCTSSAWGKGSWHTSQRAIFRRQWISCVVKLASGMSCLLETESISWSVDWHTISSINTTISIVP